MNKSTLLNQNYICPIGADGVQPFLALPSPPTDCLAVLYQLMLSRNRWLSADVSNSDRLLHSA